MISSAQVGAARVRTVATGVLAIAAGAGIAFVDSRPGFDDTGVTAAALLAAAALAAALAARRPWLWAVLVGAWVPVLEIPATGSPAPLVALAFSGVGAAAGYLVARGLTSR